MGADSTPSANEMQDKTTDPPPPANGSGPRDSKGWDGKLRVDRRAVVTNAEALSDPEYSDEDAPPVEEIGADEDLLEDYEPDSDEIDLLHCRISSLNALRLDRFNRVERLCLRQNQISHLEFPSSLGASLQDLDLYDNLISHIKGLEGLTCLTDLDLSFNNIKHIKNVNHLKNLKNLYLLQNKIPRIEGLVGLASVRNLELAANRIREIENLETLTALEELWLGKNKITELKNMSQLQNLKILSIQSNRLTRISGLSDLPNLEEIYMSHNALTEISGLDSNVNLRVLEVSNNQIQHLSGLKNLAKLEDLWASSNLFDSFQEVEQELRDKEKLTTVYFEANPLQLRSPALYRNKVRLALPQIEKIDASKYFHSRVRTIIVTLSRPARRHQLLRSSLQKHPFIRLYASMASPTIKLNSGHEMPIVGFGLWKVNNDTCADQVYNAIKSGYRLFDGACDYGNEVECGQGVARAIKDGLVKREDLFIVSKLWNSFHDHDKVEPVCKKQLEDWGIDYFDLYIVHFPISLKYVDPKDRYPPGFTYDGKNVVPGKATIQETWTAMEGLVDKGLAKSIGISNFVGSLIMDLLRYAKIVPATLQIEHHPYLTQEGLVKYAQDQGIAVTAYSSFGPQSFLELDMQQAKDTPLLFDNPTIKAVAEKNGKTPAQVLLRWATQRDVAVIPKSNNQGRLAQNLDVTGWDLEKKEMDDISGLNKGLRFNDPPNYGFPLPIYV
ncbi:MAG: hypothetical protein Q9164_004448 [Protoblastenia rupestris]